MICTGCVNAVSAKQPHGACVGYHSCTCQHGDTGLVDRGGATALAATGVTVAEIAETVAANARAVADAASTGEA